MFRCICTNRYLDAPSNRPSHYNAGVTLLLTDGTVICKNSSGPGQGNGWDRLTPVNGSYINGSWSITLDKSVAAGSYPVSVTSGDEHVVFQVIIER